MNTDAYKHDPDSSQEHYPEFVMKLFKGGDKLINEVDISDLSLMHAAVGVASEAGELLEAILDISRYQQFFGPKEDMDLKNILEELGDMKFYGTALQSVTGIWLDKRDPSEWIWGRPITPLEASNYVGIGAKKVLVELVECLNVVCSSYLLDVIKKKVFYQQAEIQKGALAQILADIDFITGNIAIICEFTDLDIRVDNVRKLAKDDDARYKDGVYSDEQAVARADKVGEGVSR